MRSRYMTGGAGFTKNSTPLSVFPVATPRAGGILPLMGQAPDGVFCVRIMTGGRHYEKSNMADIFVLLCDGNVADAGRIGGRHC